MRDLLRAARGVHLPLVWDPIVAGLSEVLRFDGVVVGGGVTANNVYALPDGMITPGEVLAQVRKIRAVVDLPLIADIDDGGGDPASVHRYSRQAEDSGASGVILEDIDCANRLSWDGASSWTYDARRLRPPEAAASNIQTATAAFRDPRTVLIARTDALPGRGLDEALLRAKAYVAAGADAVLMVGLSRDLFNEVAEELGVPLAFSGPADPLGKPASGIPSNGLVRIYEGLYPDVYKEIAERLEHVARARDLIDGGEPAGGPAPLVPPSHGAWIRSRLDFMSEEWIQGLEGAHR